MAQSTTNLDERNREICKTLKAMGEREMYALAAHAKISVRDARLVPIGAIREAFDKLRALGSIPRWGKMQCFRSGWRGSANLQKHGLPSTYSAGCRCDDCREAWRIYRKSKRAEKRAAMPLPLVETAARKSVTFAFQILSFDMESERTRIIQEFDKFVTDHVRAKMDAAEVAEYAEGLQGAD